MKKQYLNLFFFLKNIFSLKVLINFFNIFYNYQKNQLKLFAFHEK